MGRRKSKKEKPAFDDYEYGYGYDYLLDEEQKSPPTPLTMPMGRKRMTAPGGRMSRRKKYWLESGNPTGKILMKAGNTSLTTRQ